MYSIVKNRTLIELDKGDEGHFFNSLQQVVLQKISRTMDNNLINKYNTAGPRYTSYPSVPYWSSENVSEKTWIETIIKNYTVFGQRDISIYVHLPYCESLCTFCGCHKRITKNHSVEQPYIDSLINEWKLYLSFLPFQPIVKELHFGGGTPTFFKVDELIRLTKEILGGIVGNPMETELSFEAHPHNTTVDQLYGLYEMGFRRLSLGIQDYSPIVQKAIHRIQSVEVVEKVHNEARKIGYTSISHDLVFGLPKQQPEDIINTVEKTLQLKPDRIALYSYAHVPWIKGNGQRGFNESDLPSGKEKRLLYELAKSSLEAAGYLEIGMDHFALPSDSIAKAFKNKNLHRNFMGYTTQETSLLIGLGMSAISDSWFGFAQNDKTVEGYQEAISKKQLPVFKGHILSKTDQLIRRYILDLMCHFETTLTNDQELDELHQLIIHRLQPMVADKLVEVTENTVKITEAGIPFVRNACMAFDQHLQDIAQRERMFSKTI